MDDLRTIGVKTRQLIRRRLWPRLRFGFAASPHGLAGPFETSSKVLDHYIDGYPSLQNAIDAVPGWVGAMPPDTGLVAGHSTLFADTRISWLLDECYAVAGKSVLELGPLEAFHTYMLHAAGAAGIDAVEANALAFFRCLVTKEALQLDRARFYLGDFMKWLDDADKRYDLVVASGVLYHSHDPVLLLERICERADSIFLWTHYFDEVAMPPGDLRRVPFSERVETRTCRGIEVHLHERSYYKAWRDPAFCGGLQDRHFWIARADILALLGAFGFDQVRIADDEPDHVNGPSFSIFAQRAPPTPAALVPEVASAPEAAPVSEAGPVPEAAPVPVAEPVPIPVAEPVAEVAPTPEAAPVPVAEPVPEAVSVPVAEPVAEAQPVPVAEPIPEADPVPEAKPVSDADPVPETVPVPEAVTEPVPEAKPEPVAESVPEAHPVPDAKPVPKAEPAPGAEPAAPKTPDPTDKVAMP